jgi:hypothetical protein
VLLLLEIGLFVFGIWLLRKPCLTIGTYELRTPRTVFAGMILMVQLPMAVGMGVAIGGAEGIKARREGLEPSDVASKIKTKYKFTDLALVAAAATLAGLIAVTGLRPVTYEPPPPDEPVGITDHRAVMREKWAENDRIARARTRLRTEYDDDDAPRRDASPLSDEESARIAARLSD